MTTKKSHIDATTHIPRSWFPFYETLPKAAILLIGEPLEQGHTRHQSGNQCILGELITNTYSCPAVFAKVLWNCAMASTYTFNLWSFCCLGFHVGSFNFLQKLVCALDPDVHYLQQFPPMSLRGHLSDVPAFRSNPQLTLHSGGSDPQVTWPKMLYLFLTFRDNRFILEETC